MSRSRFNWLAILLGAIGALSGISNPAFAAGFSLYSLQNASGLGVAGAGSAAIANDVSTGFYNAAGLVRLRCEQIAFAGVFVAPHTKLSVTGGTATFPIGGQPIPITAGSTQSCGFSVIPTLHYGRRIDDRWVFGFNVTSPYGLKNNFPDTSLARYMATRSELVTVDISPSLAYDVGCGFSVGAGIDAVFAQAKLATSLNALSPVTGTPVTDGFVRNNASGWGVGYHVGILWQLSDCTRLGVQYRSRVVLKPRGTSTLFITGLPGTPGVTPVPVIQRARANFTLPDTLVVSAYQSFCDEQFALMGDVQWTRWKSFDRLAIRFADQSEQITPENFKNNLRFALGAAFQVDRCWTFRIGTAFDKTPTQDAFRTVRVPDQNRIWAALGVQYRFSRCLALDVGYASIFSKKANINELAPLAVPATSQTIQSLQGSSRTRADVIGIQLTWDIV